VRVVAEGAAGELRCTSEAVGDALDQAQGSGRRTEGDGQQGRQQGGGDLVAEVGEQGCRADAAHTRGEPRVGGKVRIRLGQVRLARLPQGRRIGHVVNATRRPV